MFIRSTWQSRLVAAATFCFVCSVLVFAGSSLAQDASPSGNPSSIAVSSDADTSNLAEVRDAWPRFLGARFDGISNSSLKFDWTTKPKLLWNLPVADGYGIGSISGSGHYFHFDAPGGIAERLRCIDLETGTVVWSIDDVLDYQDMLGYEGGPRGSPTLDGERVFTMGCTGRLNCREQRSGELVWSVSTNTEYGVVQNFFGVGGSPLVLGDQVIVMVGGSPAEDQSIAPGRIGRVSPAGSALVSFDAATGEERWRCGDDLASYSSPRTMQIDGETIVLLFARENLLAVDPKSGSVLWKHRHRAAVLESVNAMVPIVSGNDIFISECYEVGSVLLRATGESASVVWSDPAANRRKQAMRVHWSNPVLIDGHLYGCSGRNAPDSGFRCIEFATGELCWDDPRKKRSSVTAVGDHLLVFEERGRMQVLRTNPGAMDVVAQWDFQTPDGDWPKLAYPCWAAPVLVADKLLIRGDKKVLCLELAQQAD